MLGDTLRAVRLARGLMQRELAAAVGVSEHTVRRWESGETSPSLDRLPSLCRALGVRPEVFIDLPLRQVERYFIGG